MLYPMQLQRALLIDNFSIYPPTSQLQHAPHAAARRESDTAAAAAASAAAAAAAAAAAVILSHGWLGKGQHTGMSGTA
jgi:hypothetical protein